MVNTYAADSNYEFREIRGRCGDVNQHIFSQPKNLINPRCTDNGQPQQTEHNKNVIGNWALGNKQPDINGLHLNEACGLNEFVCCNGFLYPKKQNNHKLATWYSWDGETKEQIGFF